VDENRIRSLLNQIADSGGPPSSVDIGKARRAGLRRLVLRRIGAPAVSVSAVVTVTGLVVSGAVPLGTGPTSPAPATVRLTPKEIAVLTNTGSVPHATTVANDAFEVLIQRCMKARDLKYFPQFMPPQKPGYPGKGYPGLAGVPQATIGLAARKAHGYGFLSGASKDTRSREEKYAARAGRKYITALDGGPKDRVHFALFGDTGSVSSGGCRGVAKRRLYGAAINYLLATDGSSIMTAALFNAVTGDPGFDAVVSKWSSCMASRGFTYSSPEVLWNSLTSQLRKQHNIAQRKKLEIKVSLADYRCAKEVALLPTVHALQIKHSRHFSKALAGSLAKITRIEARAFKTAKILHLQLPVNQ
jgi:hypothetical protein